MMKKKLVLVCAIVMALPFLQSCDQGWHHGDWHWGHGGWHHGHDWDHGHDGWGHGHDHDGWGHGHHHLNVLENNPQATAQAQEASATELAEDFGIRTSSAEKILQITQGEHAKQVLSQLGINPSDFAALAQLEMPSDQAISRVAAALHEDPAKIRSIAASFVKDVRAQVADVNSEYWQDCMRGGHWKTPENSSCGQTWWSGCSPDNGASACESVK